MMFNITHKANWEFIRQRKQNRINQNNQRENVTHIPHEYAVGDAVLLRTGTENKYETPYSGPHPVVKVNNNGTLRIQKGAVEETVNIRRITPYVDETSFEQRGGCNMRRAKKKRKLN